ncbi:MAG: cbb3-type cytochrome oxidase assembly protein CcoS [Bacteroidia bacterium]
MNIIPLLILCSLSLGLLFLMVFIWWVKSGQGEDLVTPGMRVLFDDAPIAGTESSTSNNTHTEPPTESKN